MVVHDSTNYANKDACKMKNTDVIGRLSYPVDEQICTQRLDTGSQSTRLFSLERNDGSA